MVSVECPDRYDGWAATFGTTRRRLACYIASRRVSPPVGQYQIILLGIKVREPGWWDATSQSLALPAINVKKTAVYTQVNGE